MTHVKPQNVIEPEEVNLYMVLPPLVVTVGDPVVELAAIALLMITTPEPPAAPPPPPPPVFTPPAVAGVMSVPLVFVYSPLPPPPAPPVPARSTG
jgi:hypothetical protein